MVLAGAACSTSDDPHDDPPGGAAGDDDATSDTQGDRMSADGVVSLGDAPTEATIFGWIREVFDQGIRRPGYPADEWAEGWTADRFRSIGLDDVRLEPITVTRWEPTDWSLEVTGPDGATASLDCFPVPFSAPVDGLEAEVAAFDPAGPGAVRGKASLFDVPLRWRVVPPRGCAGHELPDGALLPVRRQDTPDKIDREHLEPLTRATIRIVESTRGVSAAEMRAGVVTS